MDNRTRGMLSAFICVIFWALIPVISRLGQQTLDNHQFLFWSSFFSMTALLVLCCVTGTIRILKQYTLKDWTQASALGLLGTYFYYLLLYTGYANGKGMEVLIVQYTWPIQVAVLSCLLLKETFDWRKRLALLLGFMAVICVLTRGQFRQLSVENPVLLLWVALGAFCFALFTVLSKGMKTKEPTSLMLVFFIASTIVSFITMNTVSEFSAPETIKGWGMVMLLGGIVNGLCDVIWLKALRRTEASFLAPFIFLSPVLSTFYMQLFFDEPFLPVYGIALGLIITSGVVNSLRLRKTTRHVVRVDMAS